MLPSVENQPVKRKTSVRTLYEIRHYMTVDGAGRPVGRKRRLIPRAAALRVVARLRKHGVDSHAWPLRISGTK